ncbi:MAG: twin-arginine translocase TatA/TatE family subunit [Deltaproteobacteria bacterium]|nr:twin-arginine translocase TatA/TatE family subunit [Deltaproteobacteria bacterium]
MFGIGMPELIVILVLALIILGPKKLPDLAKSLGKGLAEFRKATNELKESMNVDEDLSEVKKSVADAVSEVRKIESLASKGLKDWEKAAIAEEKKEIERRLAKDDGPPGKSPSADMDSEMAGSEDWPYPGTATGEEKAAPSSGVAKEAASSASSVAAGDSRQAEDKTSLRATEAGRDDSDSPERPPTTSEDVPSSNNPDTVPPEPSEDSRK